MDDIEHRFCGVLLIKGCLYLCREVGVGGPRKMVLPPASIPTSISSADLGGFVREALADYTESDQLVYADEWSALDRQLCESFGVRSVAAFERSKRDVSIRETVSDGTILLAGPNDQRLAVSQPDDETLGRSILTLLEALSVLDATSLDK